jgi:hypothetical protein
MTCLGISDAQAAELLEQSIAGSYEILICKDSCAAAGDDDVLVKGRLVLFSTTSQQRELDRLHLSSHYLGEEMPNACFGLESCRRIGAADLNQFPR